MHQAKASYSFNCKGYELFLFHFTAEVKIY